MTFNDKAFFDVCRQRFGSLSPNFVHGCDSILKVWKARYVERTPPPQLAYMLATTYHETAATMQPIREKGGADYFFRMYDPFGARPKVAAQLGNTKRGDGVLFHGRTYVQLTGRRNYEKATKKLRAMGFDVDFVTNPDSVMDPVYAAIILFEGMEEGWFTGLTLDRAIDGQINGDEHADFLTGRKIINGTDRAELIAKHGDGFLAALVAAAKRVELAA